MPLVYPYIDTDFTGHAKRGRSGWWASYYTARFKSKLADTEPGQFYLDDRGRDVWVTETPEFDRSWFAMQGVKPPKRFGLRTDLQTVDYGNGVTRQIYRAAAGLGQPQ